jgi:hypothetical protein
VLRGFQPRFQPTGFQPVVIEWSIGYFDHYSGQRFNTGMIRLRRLPGFSKQEIDLAQEKAEEIRRMFGWDNP